MTDPIPLKTNTGTPPSALTCPNMIAVASGKGGVGKTWFSITLCHALARQGKRVLLFDGDLGLANVDIQLGLTPDRDLGHVVEGRMPMTDAIAHDKSAGFDILAGRSGSGNLATLGTQKIAELRTDLLDTAKSYDTVLVDLGAGVDRSIRQLAGPAALTLVIVTDEPTSLTDGYAFIKLTKASSPDADLRVVVNMAASAHEGHRTYETLRKACETFLRFEPPLAGVIRRDARVRDAIRAQTPLLTRSPSADAAQDVEALAASLKF